MAKSTRGRPRTVKQSDGGNGSAPVVNGGTVDGSSVENNGGDGDTINPSDFGGAGTASAPGGDGDDGRSGGRKPRSDAGRARGPRKSAPLDLTDLKDIVVLAHAGISIAFNAPKLQLDDMEGEKLAAAVQKVLRHYDLPDVASETKDWIGLIIVAGSIYGPRMAAHWAEKNTPPPPPTAQDADNGIIQLINPAMR